MENKERPLVTFAVIAYNQEKYIRQAIEGAFSQTYSPLEIILSDDNSPDSTFSIMEEMASNYTGPHKIILNRNNPNLGIGKHVGKVMKLASKESNFIVMSAGDDISYPERTKILTEEWIKSERKYKCFGSDFERIDMDGSSLGIMKGSDIKFDDLTSIIKSNCVFGGCTGAYDLSLYRDFPSFIDGLVNEDRAFPLRCKLLGADFKFIDKPLIKYRLGGISGGSSNPFKDLYGRSYLTVMKRYRLDYLQKINDINSINPTNKDILIKECHNQININEIRIKASESPYSFLSMLKLAQNKQQKKQAIKLIIRNIFPFANAIRIRYKK